MCRIRRESEFYSFLTRELNLQLITCSQWIAGTLEPVHVGGPLPSVRYLRLNSFASYIPLWVPETAPLGSVSLLFPPFYRFLGRRHTDGFRLVSPSSLAVMNLRVASEGVLVTTGKGYARSRMNMIQ